MAAQHSSTATRAAAAAAACRRYGERSICSFNLHGRCSVLLSLLVKAVFPMLCHILCARDIDIWLCVAMKVERALYRLLKQRNTTRKNPIRTFGQPVLKPSSSDAELSGYAGNPPDGAGGRGCGE